MGWFDFSADSGNPGHNANPPPVTPPSTSPLRAGIYIRPWTETGLTLSALTDLKPTVVRINYPAFPLLLSGNLTEATRLVELIEAEITRARSIGALPLIVTTLKAIITPATQFDFIHGSIPVSDYYGSVAKRFPGCAWEIGNEQEIISGGGDSPMDTSTYAYLFNLFSKTIRLYDPTAIFVTAGTSGFNYDWTQAVLALTKPDAVGVHPYGTNPIDYATAVWNLNARGPVWFTEFGLMNITPQEVTDYFTHARGVVPLAVLFCLSDLSADKASGSMSGPEPFGLMTVTGIRRPCYDAAKISYVVKNA